LRHEPDYAAIVARAETRRQHARDAFDAAGGYKLFARAKQVS